MKDRPTDPQSGFDQFAEDYDRALAEGISVSGEDKTYFAQGRVEWFSRCLRRLGASPTSVLDFGCGTGSSVPLLCRIAGVQSVLGIDVSAKSIEVAKRANAHASARFLPLREHRPDGSIDVAFCNGVFHHIPIAERAGAVDQVRASLRPGGLFALWENNPWNPGTRYVMSRIPFDRDAITLSAPAARELLRNGGFEIISTDFLFIFPRLLSLLRVLEPWFARLPLGAQYQVLARKR